MIEDVKDNRRAGPRDVPPEWNRVTDQILASAFKVHTALGPGLLERLYETAFAHELAKRGLQVQRQVPVRITYDGIDLGLQVLDLVVGGLVVVELKSVERVPEVHFATLLSYMRSARLPLGLVINFNTVSLKDGIYRRVLSKNTPLPNAFLNDVSAHELGA